MRRFIFVYVQGILLFVFNSAFADGVLPSSFEISVAGGYSEFESFNQPQLVISNFVTDFFKKNNQHHYPALEFGVKRSFEIGSSYLNHVTIGPVIYAYRSQYTGQVWEMGLPEFYNYDYRIKSKQMGLLLEGDAYLSTIFSRIKPFFSVGVGFGVVDSSYDDSALPGIDKATELHGSNHPVKGAFSLGGGIRFALSSHWDAQVRCRYVDMGHTGVNLSGGRMIYDGLNAQNVLFGLTYTV